MSELVMNLSSPVEKTPDADLLHDTIGFAGQRLMDMEVGAAAGASGGGRASSPLADPSLGVRETGSRPQCGS